MQAVSLDTAGKSGASAQKQSVARVAGASLAGTTLEFYDHFIYGSAAALVFPKLFFPQSDPLTATLLSFASYGVAFVARPLGAAIFGHYGDKMGRKSILIITLLMMGLATFGIGLLPTYATAGALAPLLLVLLRVVQGLALGGEWGGAAIMVNELDPEGKRRGILGSLVQLAAPIGLLLANGIFALVTWQVSEEAFLSWGWRVPFLLSALLVGVGLYIRANVRESGMFEKLEESHAEARAPIMEVLRNYKKQLLIAFGARLGGDIAFYVFTLFLLYFVPTKLGLPKSIALNAVLLGALAQILFIPVAGLLADRIGRRPVLMIGGIGGAVWAFVFFAMVKTGSPALIMLASFVGMVLVSFMFSPLASFLPELFATRVRVTGASLGFQFAGVFGGALAPLIAVGLLDRFGNTMPVALYLAAVCALIAVAAFAARETARMHLSDADR
ncbi:Inner membrane metabolite transport protein YhjE [Cupriavidus taiwanensis]|uniref:Inner membrane metabolite transport protein YhjE n=1 Tax=Cupriavidus taiwanensis TaxID=164546 RepID=A0A375IAR3_9BURK|nr:MFS transporter [Cupriavidus taiwanensis]SOY50328.1 putative transporter protein, MFS family [Cupriavidus taiwanensis]SOY50397.1 putative transporter protein, MFS family [Cupriavidus taiwanensis]SOY83558.1 putative transporter protein, MFS family [Cupriavidus taiwanensis]SOZ57599.1 putative transporter protein, MFS family [Cupriavidus taiwanensis]SOZ79553.1 putative transporter protein, MFS family [Cupriavidus taiwanensis]